MIGFVVVRRALRGEPVLRPTAAGYAPSMRDRGARLRNVGIFAAALACGLTLASPAAAKPREFQGPIGPSGAISFDLKGKGERARVLDLEWYRLPVDCAKGKKDTSTGTLTYKVPVEDGKFSANAVYGNKNHPKAEAIIRGRINGERAHGTIIVRGSKLPVNDAGVGDCDSGKHPWNAAG